MAAVPDDVVAVRVPLVVTVDVHQWANAYGVTPKHYRSLRTEVTRSVRYQVLEGVRRWGDVRPAYVRVVEAANR